MVSWLWKALAGTSLPLIILYIIFERLHKKKTSLKNKVVLITGASSGLGKGCAQVFYQAGCKLILTGRNLEALKEVKSELIMSKTSRTDCELHEPDVLVLDITDFDSLSSKISSAMSLHGRIDLLVNNAGRSYRGEIYTTDLDVYRKLMEVNFLGQVAMTKAVLPTMIAQKEGTIIMISSLQGKMSIPFRSAYSSSKYALQAFSDCLRAEVGDKGVNVCVVSPGYIQTNLSLNALSGDGSIHGVMDSTTASGMNPATVGEIILNAVVNQKSDVIISSMFYKLAIYLQTLWPTVFFYLMRKRARKQRLQQK